MSPMRRRLSISVTLILLCLSSRSAPADPLPFWPPPPDIHALSDLPTAETTQLVHDLTAADYSTRERASHELVSKGFSTFPGLRSIAIASTSPELNARVSPLLKPRTLHPPRGSPPTRASASCRPTGASEKPMPSNPIGSPSSSTSVPMTNPPNSPAASSTPRKTSLPAARARSQSRRSRIPAGAASPSSTAISTAAQKRLIALLHSPDAPAIAPACITLLALRAGNNFNPAALLATLDAEPLDPDLRNDVAFLAWRAAGNPAAAAPFAARLPERDFTPAALLEARDYDALADLPQLVIRSSGRPPDRRLQVLALRFSRHPEKAAELLQRIRAPESISTFDCSAPVTLLQNDDIDGAISILRDEHQNTEAALVLIRQLRLREAFQLELDYSPEILQLLMTMGFTREADEFRRTHQFAFAANPRAAAEADLQYARLLRAAGLSAQADQLETAAWPQLSSPPQPGWFDTIVQFNEARFWLDTLTDPPADPDRIALVRKILAGRHQPALTPAIVPDLLRALSDVHSLTVAFNALARAGNLDVAQHLLDDWCARENDPAAYEILGEWQLEHGRPDLAVVACLRRTAPAHQRLSYVPDRHRPLPSAVHQRRRPATY